MTQADGGLRKSVTDDVHRPAKTGAKSLCCCRFPLGHNTGRERTFGPLQAPKALLYAPRSRTIVRLFLGSSAVEHSTVNRMVAGSNPARGANDINSLWRYRHPSKLVDRRIQYSRRNPERGPLVSQQRREHMAVVLASDGKLTRLPRQSRPDDD